MKRQRDIKEQQDTHKSKKLRIQQEQDDMTSYVKVTAVYFLSYNNVCFLELQYTSAMLCMQRRSC